MLLRVEVYQVMFELATFLKSTPLRKTPPNTEPASDPDAVLG